MNFSAFSPRVGLGSKTPYSYYWRMVFRSKGLSGHGFQDPLMGKIDKIREKYKWTHIHFYITKFF